MKFGGNETRKSPAHLSEASEADLSLFSLSTLSVFSLCQSESCCLLSPSRDTKEALLCAPLLFFPTIRAACMGPNMGMAQVRRTPRHFS